MILKSTIWIFSLEPIETRYTAQWHSHVPALIKNKLGDRFNVVQIDGVQKNSQLTPGAFLNFSDTNYWKSAQMCAFLEQHNQGKTGPNDHIIFTDAWNPTVIQLKYMSDLLGFNWKIHALWHAGSYDPQDFLGRLIGDASWVRHAEKSFFNAIDHNYFATKFHIEMFMENLLGVDFRTGAMRYMQHKSIVQTGWPMDYMDTALAPYKNMSKKDIILFPHRIAPEKQVEIFRDLKEQLPQYEFVVCQDQELTKNEYHNMLGEAKIVFSASLQETLGIGCYEGALLGAIPMVPDRLSYTEMYFDTFKYPSQWTLSYQDYEKSKKLICDKIVDYIENYDQYKIRINTQSEVLTRSFFSASKLLENIK